MNFDTIYNAVVAFLNSGAGFAVIGALMVGFFIFLSSRKVMTMRRMLLLIAISGLLPALTGCSGIRGVFAPRIEPHPDAPILITDTFGGFVEGAVYDKDRNAMVPCGWHWIGRYDGWTLHRFDWNERIDTQPDTSKQD